MRATSAVLALVLLGLVTLAGCEKICGNGACETDNGESCQTCPNDCGEEVEVPSCPEEAMCPSGGLIRAYCEDEDTLICCGP